MAPRKADAASRQLAGSPAWFFGWSLHLFSRELFPLQIRESDLQRRLAGRDSGEPDRAVFLNGKGPKRIRKNLHDSLVALFETADNGQEELAVLF